MTSSSSPRATRDTAFSSSSPQATRDAAISETLLVLPTSDPRRSNWRRQRPVVTVFILLAMQQPVETRNAVTDDGSNWPPLSGDGPIADFALASPVVTAAIAHPAPTSSSVMETPAPTSSSVMETPAPLFSGHSSHCSPCSTTLTAPTPLFSGHDSHCSPCSTTSTAPAPLFFGPLFDQRRWPHSLLHLRQQPCHHSNRLVALFSDYQCRPTASSIPRTFMVHSYLLSKFSLPRLKPHCKTITALK